MYKKHNNAITLTAFRSLCMYIFFCQRKNKQVTKKSYMLNAEKHDVELFFPSFLILVLTKHLFISAQPHQRHNFSTPPAVAAQREKIWKQQSFFRYFFLFNLLTLLFSFSSCFCEHKKFSFFYFFFCFTFSFIWIFKVLPKLLLKISFSYCCHIYMCRVLVFQLFSQRFLCSCTFARKEYLNMNKFKKKF